MISSPAHSPGSQMNAAQAAAMQQQMAAMQATILRLETAAAAAPPPPQVEPPEQPVDLIAQALTAAVAAARGPKDHSKDLNYFPHVSLDETPITTRADDFRVIAQLEQVFSNKKTPDEVKVPLVVCKLKGRALHVFKSFTNANGNINNASTTTFAEFKRLMLTLVSNNRLEYEAIEKEYEALSQKNGSAEKFGNAYYSLVEHIHANKESSLLHNDHQLKVMFVRKLKPAVQLHFDRSKLISLEEAIAEAVRADKLVYASAQAESPAKQFKPFSSPPSSGYATPSASRVRQP
eukprot:499509-Rhodomonas_salina.2